MCWLHGLLNDCYQMLAQLAQSFLIQAKRKKFSVCLVRKVSKPIVVHEEDCSFLALVVFFVYTI
jgi:hypothetical protein